MSRLHREEQRVRRILDQSLRELNNEVKVVAEERVLLSRIFDAGFISLVRRDRTPFTHNSVKLGSMLISLLFFHVTMIAFIHITIMVALIIPILRETAVAFATTTTTHHNNNKRDVVTVAADNETGSAELVGTTEADRHRQHDLRQRIPTRPTVYQAI